MAARGEPLALLHPRLPPAARAALIARLPAAVPPDTFALLHTAGSTGAPKWVILPRRAFLASAAASAARLGWHDDDRWLLALAPGHIGGLSILTRCLIARRAVVLAAARFDPADLAARCRAARVTLASLVPTQLDALLEHGGLARGALRAVLVGGAASGPALLDRARAAALPIVTTYGMTETCSQVALDGRVLPGIDLRVRAGVLEVRGAVCMTGYAGEPVRAADAWLTTGDRARLEGDRLEILGRSDDVIVTGGENVDPLAVERALERVPGIRAACVFGVPDPRWGARVAVALVAGPGLALDALRDELAAALAPHQRPRLVAIVPRLPETPLGKLDRRAAARDLAATLRPL